MSGKSSASFLLRGAYRVQVLDGDVSVCDSGEFDNLLTDAALSDPRPFAGFSSSEEVVLCIGAGVVTPPSYSDNDLGNQIAQKRIGSGWGRVDNFIAQGDASTFPVIFKAEQEVEFTGIEGDLSELGVRKGGVLMSRSLIKDGSGNPITISVNAQHTVRITYAVYSIVPTEILATGVLSTPGGDVGYSVVAGSQGAYGIAAYDYKHPMATSGSYTTYSLFDAGRGAVRPGTVSNAAEPVSFDGVARTVTVRPEFGYTETDFDVYEIWGSNNSVYAPRAPKIIFDTPISLPAYFDFKIDITFTWDRYDPGP